MAYIPCPSSSGGAGDGFGVKWRHKRNEETFTPEYVYRTGCEAHRLWKNYYHDFDNVTDLS